MEHVNHCLIVTTFRDKMGSTVLQSDIAQLARLKRHRFQNKEQAGYFTYMPCDTVFITNQHYTVYRREAGGVKGGHGKNKHPQCD